MGDQLEEIVKVCNSWNISTKLFGVRFDTTADNTGCHVGSVTLFQKQLENVFSGLPAADFQLRFISRKWLKCVLGKLLVLTILYSRDCMIIGWSWLKTPIILGLTTSH